MPYKVETVIKHAAQTVGEGPHWDVPTQRLLYVDINKGDVHRWDPTTAKDEKVHLDGTVGFVIPRSSGGLVLGLNLSVVGLDWESGTTVTLATVDERKDNRLNDAKCDASGRLWAGTMNTGSPRVQRVGNLYSLGGDGQLQCHVEGVTVSNGLAWSADNKTMFYIDTPTRQVWAYDFDLEKGTMANQRVVVDFSQTPEFEGTLVRPDGMTIDTDDNLWVACLNVGSVAQFDSRTGQMLRRVELPNASMITSVCWGGPDLNQLYVTSLVANFTEQQLNTTESLAGSVFRVTGLGTKGKVAPVFQG
ncbi:regucalcin-like [Haliotis rubra]|uniref:regucalcin-like n=1 Tax=Haliotis rubra TaxID=36100 RepID=UPI001EE5039D|nr:regucalcin-like [Haliotis rubra]